MSDDREMTEDEAEMLREMLAGKRLFVVACYQHYANSFSVIGVYSTRARAEKKAAEMSDFRIEEFLLDEHG